MVVVVPAYEIKMIPCTTFEQCTDFYRVYYPKTKQQLRACVSSRRCNTFRPHQWLHDYYPSDWFYTSRKLTTIPCWKTDTQDPYGMVKLRPGLPRFNESFVNYAYDKVAWFEELRYIGYRFDVLTDGYSVDIPHPE